MVRGEGEREGARVVMHPGPGRADDRASGETYMSSTRTPHETVGRMPMTSQSSTSVTSGALRGTSTVTVRSG